MKLKYTLLTFSLLLSAFAFSQKVSNIYFEQVGKQIHIYYDLSGNQNYSIKVFCSTDNGKNWGVPLMYVSGNVGPNQTPGYKKVIFWDVLQETTKLSGYIQFKIIAVSTAKIISYIPNDFNGNKGIFIDTRDGQEYKWVRIGDQIWMAENINIGRRIHHKSLPIRDKNIEKYCYDNNEAMCNDYGGLYTWDEAMQSSMSNGYQGICPEGWHIPSKEEWSDLVIAVDETLQTDYKELNKQRKSKKGVVGIMASHYLKSSNHWVKNSEAWDSFEFDALPSGKINYKPTKFEYLGKAALFWTSTIQDKDYAWFRLMNERSVVNSGHL